MQISNFLQKFKTIIHNEGLSKKIICEILTKHLQKEFNPEKIKVNKGILYLQIDSFIKNSILFKKDKILQDLNKITDFKIRDIQ